MAAVEEDAEDGEALEKDGHIGGEALEEAAGITAAVEEDAKDWEALEEDEHVVFPVH